MSTNDSPAVPADPTSRDRLAAEGLDYRLVDPSDAVAFAPVAQALARGFLGAEPTDESIDEQRAQLAHRRFTGVFDERTVQADVPVATVESWKTPLTVPGGEVDMWAISGVTVAGTHRRRGIARAMLEGELRAAADAGLVIAGLTVTETTIYGRYGFGAAVPAGSWQIDTRRAGWGGGAPSGRLEFIGRGQLAADLGELHERTRDRRVGEIAGWPLRWTQYAGLAAGAKDGDQVRGVRHVDADGVVRGAMAYVITRDDADIAAARLDISHLVAESAAAENALWGFALQHDLVSQVTARLRPLDDTIRWLVRDERGAVQTTRDHGWLRILDLPLALEARTYAAAADVVLEVSDPLGLTTGTWRLAIDAEGVATVTTADGEEPDLRLGIAELSASYLGGTPLAGLHAAGRVTGDEEAAAALTVAQRPARPPHLSIWY